VVGILELSDVTVDEAASGAALAVVQLSCFDKKFQCLFQPARIEKACSLHSIGLQPKVTRVLPLGHHNQLPSRFARSSMVTSHGLEGPEQSQSPKELGVVPDLHAEVFT